MSDRKLGVAAQIGVAFATYIAAEIVMVAAAYFWVFVYSMTIHTGGDQAYYEAYAQISSPVVAVLTAGPVFYVATRLLRRRWAEQAQRLALYAASLNIVLVVLLIVSGDLNQLAYNVGAAILATGAMFVGAWYGGRTDPAQAT